MPFNFLNSAFVCKKNLRICFVYSSSSHLSKSLRSFLSVGTICELFLTHHTTELFQSTAVLSRPLCSSRALSFGESDNPEVFHGEGHFEHSFILYFLFQSSFFILAYDRSFTEHLYQRPSPSKTHWAAAQGLVLYCQ